MNLFSLENLDWSALPIELIMICAILVILMQLGFACLEAGLVDAKNVISVLYKNLLDFCFGFIAFIVVWTTFFNQALDTPRDIMLVFYDATFAATAATICSGALAGRIRLGAYIILSLFITTVLYPTMAYYLFLNLAPDITNQSSGIFFDMAGSVVVHAVGGSAALAAAFYVGKRKIVPQSNRLRKHIPQSSNHDKKIAPENRTVIVHPHSFPLAYIGTFLLIIGWFGFNIGSAKITGSISIVALNTALGATAGGISAFIVGFLTKTPSISLSMNGVLGGLVGITAGANLFEPASAALVGMISGFCVVAYLSFAQRTHFISSRIEDPVGAIPVHCLCGIIGGVAVYAFAEPNISPFKGEAFTLYDPNWQLGLTILVPIVTFILVLAFLAILDLLLSQIKVLGRVKANETEQGLGLDVVDYIDNAYHYGTQSEKPEDLLEILVVLNNRHEPNFQFESCAGDQSEHSKGKQAFKPNFAYWLEEIKGIAQRYSDAFGDYSVDNSRTSAISLYSRINREHRRLSQYVIEPSKQEKKDVFNERIKHLKQATDTLKDTLVLHVGRRQSGNKFIEETAKSIEELKTKVENLQRQIDVPVD